MLELLNWTVRALSFFNTIALLWLGLTVILNAERRSLGTWLTSAGLLLGGIFFAGHSTLVARPINMLDVDLLFWWNASPFLFVVPPLLWYAVMVWYNGVTGRLGHRVGLALMVTGGAIILWLPVTLRLLPSYGEITGQQPLALTEMAGLPVALLIYPTYGVVNSLLALLTLYRPLASQRFMGALGRERARPWLIASSSMLLVVSVAVGGVAFWLWREMITGRMVLLSPSSQPLIMSFDLVISALLSVLVVLLGRAIVSYEIFTGKVLPRGGLYRYWRNSLILGTGFGLVLGGSLAVPVDPVYRLLLATIVMTVFYALLSWRSYVERERGIQRLRPFVSGQRIYEHLLVAERGGRLDLTLPFRALCEEVLGAGIAHLIPLGPLAPLAGPPLVHPPVSLPPLPELAKLTAQMSASTICQPVDPSQFGGAQWAIPLWSERGLIGVLLLGAKRDGGLYVQEEIEIARATGERLIDTQASAEMARRLMNLQRQTMAQSQVLDQQARRVLHDDILPLLHTSLIGLNSAATEPSHAVTEAVQTMTEVHRRIADLMRAMPSPVAPTVAKLGLIGALKQTIGFEFANALETVRWQLDPTAEVAANKLPSLTAEVLYGAAREAIRNARRHGVGPEGGQTLHLGISVAWRQGLEIVIEDDGAGFPLQGQASTGTGQGLALHSTLMAVVGGTLSIESAVGEPTRIGLFLPEAAIPSDGLFQFNLELPTGSIGAKGVSG